MFMSAITIHELDHGVLLAGRAEAERAAVLRPWLGHSVTSAFATRVLPLDEAVARFAASLHASDPAPFRRALIGATARPPMAVFTPRRQDFERFDGLDVVNPWR